MLKIMMPEEIVVWYIIPSIRKEFARIMIDKGLIQKQVAAKLNITESAVSQYVKSKRGTEVTFDKRIMNDIRKAVDKILERDDKLVLIHEIQGISESIKNDFTLCKIHKKYNKDLPEDCKICFE